MTSTSYPQDLRDWRGLFIRHLVYALANLEGLQLKHWSPPGEIPDTVEYAATEAEAAWLQQLMAEGGIAHALRSKGPGGLMQAARLLSGLWRLYRRETAIDVRHVNWLQNALVLPADRRPLLVTVLGTDMQLLRVPGMTGLLRRVFRQRATAICPNAEWMLPELTRRFGDLAEIRSIPFGIDPAWYELQRVPFQPERWLCVSRITRGKLGSLLEWCEPHFRQGPRELHLLGPMQEALDLPAWVRAAGPVTPQQLRDTWFPQAQGLITLSQHAEGRPQVMLEAMASGLPIIASAIPAHADLLQHGHSGWLCHNAGDVASGLAFLSDPAANVSIGTAARAQVLRDIGTWSDCAGRYRAMYEHLLHRAG